MYNILLPKLLGSFGPIMGSEANDDMFDVHHYGNSNCFLRCPNGVAKNQKEVMCEQTH